MKPKAKAKELVDKFTATTHPMSRIMTDGKQCALICVDEIIISYGIPMIIWGVLTDKQIEDWNHHVTKLNEYYQEVKEEIEKL